MFLKSFYFLSGKKTRLVRATFAIVVSAFVVKADEVTTVLPSQPVSTLPEIVVTQAVDLPHLPNADGESSDFKATPETIGPVTLIPAGEIDLASVTLSLDQSLINRRGIRYELKQQENSIWQVLAMPSGSTLVTNDSNTQTESIGRIRLGESGLEYAWEKGAESQPRIVEALKGAVLVATTDGQTQYAVALRGCVQWSPMPLDMRRSPIRTELPIQTMPGDVELAVRIERIESAGYAFTRTESEVPVGWSDRDSVCRADAAQTEVQLRLQQKPIGCVLEARFYYVDHTGRRHPFEAQRVKRSLGLKQRQLERSEAVLRRAASALPSLKRSLASTVAHVPRDAEQYQKSRQKVKALQASVKRAESLIRKNRGAIPKLKESIEVMDGVADVGRELHGKAKVHACVYAVTKAFRVPLVRLGDAT